MSFSSKKILQMIALGLFGCCVGMGVYIFHITSKNTNITKSTDNLSTNDVNTNKLAPLNTDNALNNTQKTVPNKNVASDEDEKNLNLATEYLNSNDVNVQRKAVPILQEIIKQGTPSKIHDQATLHLAKILYEGKLAQQDANQAEFLLAPLLEKNDPEAYFYMSKLYLENSDKSKYQQGLNFLITAAKLKNPIALENLGELLYNGVLVQQDKQKAKQLLEEADKLGNMDATNKLGFLYYVENSSPSDLSKAYELFVKAANNGSADAQYNLGSMYLNGIYVAQDIDKAKEFLSKASNAGNSLAQFRFGKLLVEQPKANDDIDQGLSWLEKSANTNNMDAINYLGLLYYSGKNMKQDLVKAKTLFEKAVALGDRNNAAYNLATMYYDGKGGKKNQSQALNLFKLAAKNGNDKAQYLLGVIYLSGENVKRDVTKAMQLFDSSARKGNPAAALLLGDIFSKGFRSTAKNNSSKIGKKSGRKDRNSNSTVLIQVNKKKAKTYYGLACDVKSSKGCELYHKL